MIVSDLNFSRWSCQDLFTGVDSGAMLEESTKKHEGKEYRLFSFKTLRTHIVEAGVLTPWDPEHLLRFTCNVFM